ncbi:hypothetical protein B4589_004000 [Halolamina sp. CBA1230]|uniref:DUF5803 family protein n=1 Tax=Halolamina sp. CBA1230 TaxID=1853690 RepID=UPI0009A18481|nr:DUF5803 family protein [Halolamina sp. CBA1230]QKY19580.1 hypothetical protein B4589_004000 [Halolamina sp. CBA1230]
MNRRLLALVALVGLVTLSGCMGGLGGGGPTSPDRLDEPPEAAYDWDAADDVHITVTSNVTYRAVYDASAVEEDIRLSRPGFLGTDQPLTISSLRYRYPNGTTINGSAFGDHGGDVRTQNNHLVIEPPGEEGWVAYSGESTPKQFTHPVAVEEGNYTVVLPEDREASIPLFGRIAPPADSKTVVDGHLTIEWTEISRESLSVRFYLPRDVQLFAGLLVGLLGVAIVGGAYYLRQIRELQERREEMGFDIDIEQDDDDGPPPGMG